MKKMANHNIVLCAFIVEPIVFDCGFKVTLQDHQICYELFRNCDIGKIFVDYFQPINSKIHIKHLIVVFSSVQ